MKITNLGSGITSALIAGGLVAGVALVLASSMEMFHTETRTMRQRNQYELYVNKISRLLSKPEHCMSLLDGVNGRPALMAAVPPDVEAAITNNDPYFMDANNGFLVSPRTLTRVNPNDANLNKDVMVSGTDYHHEGFTVLEFRFTGMATTANPSEVQATLTLRADKLGKFSGSPHLKDQEFDIGIEMDAGRIPTSCQCVNCGKSVTTDQCQPGQVLVGLDAGASVCEPAVPCDDDEVLSTDVVEDQNGNPLLDENGDAVVGWVCKPYNPGGGSAETVRLCQDGCQF